MNLQGCRVLVTGASGRLGGRILRELTEHGARPVAHVRASSDTSLIDELGIEKRAADLRNRPEILTLTEGVEAVIHTAALVDFRGDRLTQFTGINTIGALEVYHAARRSGVKRFVQVSSVAAVGAIPRRRRGSQPKVIDETHEFNLRHLHIPYMVTKRAAEEELTKAAAQGGPELVIVNPSIILAPSITGGQLPSLLQRLNGWLPALPTRINLVDGRDVAAGVAAALGRGHTGERYILGGDTVTLRELAVLAKPYLNKKSRFFPAPRPVLTAAASLWRRLAAINGHSRLSLYPDLVRLSEYDWAFSSQKAERTLGYSYRPLAETLRDLMSALKQAE